MLTRLSAAKALHLAGPGLVQQNVGAYLQHWQAMLIWYVLMGRDHLGNTFLFMLSDIIFENHFVSLAVYISNISCLELTVFETDRLVFEKQGMGRNFFNMSGYNRL